MTGGVGACPQHRPAGVGGARSIFQIKQDRGAVGGGVGGGRVARQRAVVASQGRARVAASYQRQAFEVPCPRVGIVARQRGVRAGQGRRRMAAPQIEDAEIDVGRQVPRIAFQHMAIQHFSPGQIARLMPGDGRVQ